MLTLRTAGRRQVSSSTLQVLSYVSYDKYGVANGAAELGCFMPFVPKALE